jgi:hypothetical protein
MMATDSTTENENVVEENATVEKNTTVEDNTESESSPRPFADPEQWPFPHENVPNNETQNLISEPDGQLAFDFDVYPPDTGHGIESPDLTDPALFESVPRTHAELVQQRREEGTLPDGDVPEDTGPVLEQPTWSEINAGLVPEYETTSAEAQEERDPSVGMPGATAEQMGEEDAGDQSAETTEENATETANAVEDSKPKRRSRSDVTVE